MYLHHPQFDEVRRLLAARELGPLHAIRARFGIPELARPGFRNDPALGGGAFLDVGCYPLSIASALLEGEPEVLFADVRRAPAGATDAAGCAVLRDARGVTAMLDWAVGVAYRNELDLWGAAGSASAERVFSKEAGLAPEVLVRDARGAISVRAVAAVPHFVRMLEAFAALVHDEAGAERERETILRRARLRDRVRDHSSR